ncbi:sn1-specific diacylglycerol lipase beta-like isoform X2 [Centruroides sculpturatus]|nr:sn1-specific diacylglycerol lipase beta-like isoform X2 [Centruroides sculpturatus]
MSCCRKKPTYIIDDNCCECNTAALKRVTGLTEENLVYVSFQNKVYEVPFYVAIDHQTCSIVVSIRGTLSLSDVLTDLTAECEVLSDNDRSNGIFCHRGMLLAANYVKDKLEETNLLNEVLSVNQSYSLVITGHSLGAGTASVLALLLRSKYPTLKCFAYSPPGGLLNADGVKHSEDFIFSVVVGDDLVSRLSVPTMEDMKRNILSCLTECDQPKYKVLLGVFCNKTSNSESETAQRQVSRPLLPEHISTGSYESTGIQERSFLMKNTASCSSKLSSTPLFLPGRILHLTEVNGSYRAKWVSAEFFNQIIISPNMIHDHMPNVVYKSLLQLTRNSNQFLP